VTRFLLLLFLVFFPLVSNADSLQDKIDQLAASGGGVLYLEPGSIVVMEPIILRKGVSLRGAYPPPADPEDIDPSRHTILRAYHSNMAVLRTEPGWQGEIENLVIDGRWIARFGIVLENVEGSELRNLLIMHMDEVYGTGLYLVATEDGRCKQNYFHNVNVFYGRIGVWFQSLNGNPITLNIFNACHITADYISVRFTDYTDSNYFINCRIGTITYGVAFEDDPDVYNNIFLFPVIEAIEPDAWGIVCKPSDTVYTAPNKFIEPYFGYFFYERWENYICGNGNCRLIYLGE